MNANSSRNALIILIIFAIIMPIVFLLPPFLTTMQCVTRSTQLNIRGSTALYPLVNEAAQAYMSRPCFFTHIKVVPSSSQDGLTQLGQGKVDIGNSDLFADPNDPRLQGLIDHQIAVVVFALVVHKSVALRNVTSLNTQQLQSIYGGAYHNWQDIDPTISGITPIITISRPLDSGTRATFGQYVLGGLESVSGTPPDDNSEDVARDVCNISGAIGYISLYYYYEHQGCLKLLNINGQQPTLAGVLDTQKPYTFWNIEHMYTNSHPDELTQKFITYMYSATVKSYIEKFDQFGYLDISDIASVLKTHLTL